MLATHTPGLPARLASGRPIAGYNGFDPSGPSLHIGNLVPIFGLLHFQQRGGRPVIVVGGATGMVGDPSGRSSERTLLDRESLAANVAAIRLQLERFLDFSPAETGALMVDNLDWLGSVGMLDFLRDVGKHFTVPYMLAKDSVQTRLDRGLSFTEFAYMLLQATDFEHLHRTLGVELQMGGADQWGNITAGLELIRRRAGTRDEADEEAAHGLAYPLLTNPSGDKFGKTAEGTSVWLDPAVTSPFAFYQYWLNAADADVGQHLRTFTLLDHERIAELEAEQAATPEARPAQRALARDITERVHGGDATRLAIRVSEAAFARTPSEDPEVLGALHREADGFDVTPPVARGDIIGFLVESGVLASRGEARRMIAGGAITVNGTRIMDPAEPTPAPIAGEWWQVAVGKRRRRVGRLVQD
jgi:tyrosyl-tRNA synthetase